ncbi:MAG TPA: hypothetical protein VGR62_00815 [Candidatus Binatia bacterium]|jgi:hypothetical protein|nr:hypothetical protein [Candidatus Binatia bacterium]
MADLLADIVGTCAASYRNLMGRAMKAGAPLTAFLALIGDLGAPLARFVLWFTIASSVITVVAGFLWFGRYQRAMRQALADGRLTQAEVAQATETNVWSVSFAFGLISTIVLALVLAAQNVGAKPDTGIVATVVPGVEHLQSELFAIRGDVARVQQTTDRIAADTTTVLAKLDDLSAAFERATTAGVVVANPSTPAEHYHNARLYELKSDFAGARTSYNAYLASGVEFIDPYLSYVDMLKVQDGLDGAREIVGAMRKTNHTVSLETASALLLPKEQRAAALTQIIAQHPDHAPAVYLLSREYSVEKLGEQTIADKRREKALLAQLADLNAKGQFQRWLLDKREAKGWLDDADARAAKLAGLSATVLDTPVTMSATPSNAGWTLTLGFADTRVKDIAYRIDGHGDFVSTGVLAMNDPQTGQPMPNPNVPLGKVAPGAHTIDVRYVDLAGATNGPFTLPFDTGTADVKFGKMALEQTSGAWLSVQPNGTASLVYFTQLLSFRSALREIRYSFDSEALDQTFPFTPVAPGGNAFEVGDGPLYLEAPKTLRFVAVQLVYADGTRSAMKTFTP